MILVLGLASCRRLAGDAPLRESPAAPGTAAPGSPLASWDHAYDDCTGSIERADDATAERACTEALSLSEAFGESDGRRASSLHAMGMLREAEGRYAEAEIVYRRALASWQSSQGREGYDTAVGANSLGAVLEREKRYDEATAQYERAQATFEREGKDADLARVLNNVGNLHRAQHQYALAEPVLRRALAIKERVDGPDGLGVAITVQNLATVCDELQRFAEAEPLYRRALTIKEARLGAEHPSVAVTLANLGAMKLEQHDMPAAEPLLRRAVAILEKARGPSHPDVREPLVSLARLLRATGRAADAAALDERVNAIDRGRQPVPKP